MPRSVRLTILFAVALSGCGDDPCSEIKAKLASCQQPVAAEGECSTSLLDSYDMLMSVDCMALSGAGGKASTWLWLDGGCDPGYHRCLPGGLLCCKGKGPADKIREVINNHARIDRTPYADMGSLNMSCSVASWRTGMDCSCFVQQTFKEALGIDILRDSRAQQDEAAWVFARKPGDLVFFHFPVGWKPWEEGRRTWQETKNWLADWLFDPTSHVGIHLGVNETGREVFAHMSSHHNEIRVVDLEDFITYAKSEGGEYKGAGRVLDYGDGVGY